ncbi:MAG: permease [Ichthyobacteriaceae bacterium]|nr:permease [Ichthyobacteriaceae bacterium]
MNLLKHISKRTIIIVTFFIFLAFSFFADYTPGVTIGVNFKDFLLQMVTILPPIFILIGLFDVWVKKETIIKHLGEGAGAISYFWVFVLAAPMAGGLLPGFPIAYSLHKKGARIQVILVFLGAIGVGRVPMLFFESTFLGWEFTLIRVIVSIPLVIISGIVLGKKLNNEGYKLPEVDVKSKKK